MVMAHGIDKNLRHGWGWRAPQRNWSHGRMYAAEHRVTEYSRRVNRSTQL